MPSLTPKVENQNIHHLVLNNGITSIAIENQAADVIAARIFFKNAGARWEPRERAGISHLLAAVITKGTESLSSGEIAEKIEAIGANLGADAAADYLGLGIKTVSGDFGEMFKLAAEIMRAPTFPTPEVELEKHLTIQSIRSQQEQPFNVAFNQLREAMYPEHPYGISILGTEATVATLERSHLEAYHREFFRPDNLVISLAGRFQVEQMVKLIEDVLGDWQSPATAITHPQLPILSPQQCQRITPQDTQQVIVMLGYLTAAVKHPDYPVLKLLSTYLGNGLSSRLFVELREKRGLAYDVSAFYPTRLDESQFVVYMGTAPENTAIALAGLRTEVERLCEQKLTETELQAAKNKLLGQYALGKQTNAEIAHLYGWYETLGLGIDFDTQFPEQINQVTPTMAREVALRYLTEPYISLVGPETAIKY